MSVKVDIIHENEEVTGAIDSSNLEFSLDSTPDPKASLEVLLNGVFQTQDVDYTLQNDIITFVEAPVTNSILRVGYRSANVGSVTIGTLTGVTIQSSAEAKTGVKITADGITIYGEDILLFKSSGGTLIGKISATDGLIINAVGGDLNLIGANGIYFTVGAEEVVEFGAVGEVQFEGDVKFSGVIAYTRDLTAEVIADASHYILVKVNGTDYKLLLKSV